MATGELPQPVSDGDGKFTIPDLPPGRYTLSAALDGFQAVEMAATVAPGATVTLALDLPIALTEHVDVVARTVVSTSDSLATTETVDSKETQLLSPGEGIQTAVRLTPGVIELSRGNSIDGARPNQTSQQIGSADARRSGDQPVARHAAGRRHRLDFGHVEPVRSGVRQVFVRSRDDPDPPRRRRLEGPRQQPRAEPAGEAVHGAST